MYIPKGELQPIENESALKEIYEKLTPQQRREQPVFEKGETVLVKGAPFRVESLGTHLMTLKPLPREASFEEKRMDDFRAELEKAEREEEGNNADT